MSPHAVNSFVSDLVTMAQAMERLPQIEHERDEWMEKANEHLLTLIDRDKDLEQAKAYSASLEQKVHALEVAKDAAETMFLQADDRTMRAVEFIKAQFGAAGSLIQALEPERAKPEPMRSNKELKTAMESGNYTSGIDEHITHDAKETKAFDDGGPYNEPQVSEVKPIAADPTNADMVEQSSNVGSTTEPIAALSTSIDPPQGQSEPDPMPVHTPEPLSNSAPTLNVSSSEDASSAPSWASPAPDTKPQPYAGLSYQDYPRYVSFNDWIDGGGSSDTYYYPLHRN